MLSLSDLKNMTVKEMEKALAGMSQEDKRRIGTEGRKQHRGRTDYLKNAINAGIYKDGMLVGDKNAKDDIWEEV